MGSVAGAVKGREFDWLSDFSLLKVDFASWSKLVDSALVRAHIR